MGALVQIVPRAAGKEMPDAAGIDTVSGAMFHQIGQNLNGTHR